MSKCPRCFHGDHCGGKGTFPDGVPCCCADCPPAKLDAPPYPFCWDKKGCAGKTYCTKEHACND